MSQSMFSGSDGHVMLAHRFLWYCRPKTRTNPVEVNGKPVSSETCARDASPH
jgi:hypothetical protein